MEIAFFIKGLETYIENVNKIDLDTIMLLNKACLVIDKLRKDSEFEEKSSLNLFNIFHALNDKYFEFRNFIYCHMCGVS